MKRLIIEMYEDLIYQLKKLDFIESLTLIGEPLKQRATDKVIDLDIVIVVKREMRVEKYTTIERIFSNICRKYTKKRIDFLYAIADGPMKPRSLKEQEIFLHCILHTRESYKNNPLLLCKNSWQYYKPIEGKPLMDYQSFRCVTNDMLLNSALGINHLMKLVSKDSSGYIGWKKSKHGVMKWKMVPLKFKDLDERADLYIYSVLRSASNTLRFLIGNNSIGIDTKMGKLFENKFGRMKSRNLPLKLVNEKKLLRNKKYGGDNKFLKKQALDFLKELKYSLKSN